MQKKIQHEADEQAKLFKWVAFARSFIPAVDMLYHIPNGGKRNEREAAALKRQGVRSGVPDLCLPVSSGDYHGLYIELKYGNNKPTKNQITWLNNLKHYGYAAVVCYGWQAAAKCICNYLNVDVVGFKE
jgi:hypothetical protein